MKNNNIFKRLPELRTKRVILRGIKKTDIDDIFNYARIPEVAKYTIWSAHRSKKDTEVYMKFVLARQKAGEPVSWAIVDRKTGKMIGAAGFESYSEQHKTAGIGYVLAKGYWGQGYMTEAVKIIIGFGFNHAGLNRIEAVCDVKNIGSARVMEKAGMKFEGIQKSRIISAKGRVHDVKSYAIIRKDLR
jgi:ribosomal-protein-alanine N-acetyltransferase